MRHLRHVATVVMGVALALAAGIQMHAAPLQLSFSDILAGYPGPGISAPTTLGGVTIAENTPFTFDAWFDTTNGFTSQWGDNLYPMTSFTLTLGGTTFNGTYTGIPTPALNVLLTPPTVTNYDGYYGIGISGTDGSGNWWNADTQPTAMFFGWQTTTPTLNTASPSESVFSNPLFICYSAPLNIPLVGVTGGLQINDGANGYAVVYPQYAGAATQGALIAPVPEPTTLALAACGGLGGLLGVRRWRRARRNAPTPIATNG